jgi:hypothetical protein
MPWQSSLHPHVASIHDAFVNVCVGWGWGGAAGITKKVRVLKRATTVGRFTVKNGIFKAFDGRLVAGSHAITHILSMLASFMGRHTKIF